VDDWPLGTNFMVALDTKGLAAGSADQKANKRHGGSPDLASQLHFASYCEVLLGRPFSRFLATGIATDEFQ
jgi:hypothetical protein